MRETVTTALSVGDVSRETSGCKPTMISAAATTGSTPYHDHNPHQRLVAADSKKLGVKSRKALLVGIAAMSPPAVYYNAEAVKRRHLGAILRSCGYNDDQGYTFR